MKILKVMPIKICGFAHILLASTRSNRFLLYNKHFYLLYMYVLQSRSHLMRNVDITSIF